MPFAVTTVVLATLAGSVSGADRVKFYDTDGADGNDGFVADLNSNGYNEPTGDYVTFCAESLEAIGYGIEYEYAISLEVKDNDGNGNRGIDSVAGRRMAYLFKEFSIAEEAAIRGLDATFAGYSDKEIRTLVQLYIWDRFAYPDGDDWSSGSLYSDARFDLLSAVADTNGAQGSLHGVRVMNIYVVGHLGDDAFGGQDMLTVIPLPSSAAMAFTGLFGLGFARRRRG
jgi:hypothetical protein